MTDKIRRLLEQAERQAQSAETGESSIASASRDFGDAAAAENFFRRLLPKLFRVEQWNAASFLTSFELFDADGKISGEKSAVAGDFIRLSLAGSGKNDWVEIAEIFQDADQAVVTVKPSRDPTESQPNENRISHFFTDDSTNNFCLAKTGQTVSFYVVGLNETTNTGETENLFEKARNFAVSNVGSYLGIQKGEWQTFCENFLGAEK